MRDAGLAIAAVAAASEAASCSRRGGWLRPTPTAGSLGARRRRCSGSNTKLASTRPRCPTAGSIASRCSAPSPPGAGRRAPASCSAPRFTTNNSGDHHRFGFPSDTALVVGRSALFLALGAGHAVDRGLRHAHHRLSFAARAATGGGQRALAAGWELYATLEGDRARAITTAPKVGWGVLAPIADRGELTDHALASLSMAYFAYFPESGAIVDRARRRSPRRSRWGSAAASARSRATAARARRGVFEAMASPPRAVQLSVGGRRAHRGEHSPPARRSAPGHASRARRTHGAGRRAEIVCARR